MAEQCRENIELDQIQKPKSNPRFALMEKFFAHGGLMFYYETNMDKDESFAEAVRILNQPMEKYEKQVMSLYHCDPSWPICLYDYTFRNQNPKFVVYRV